MYSRMAAEVLEALLPRHFAFESLRQLDLLSG